MFSGRLDRRKSQPSERVLFSFTQTLEPSEVRRRLLFYSGTVLELNNEFPFFTVNKKVTDDYRPLPFRCPKTLRVDFQKHRVRFL